MFSEKVIRRALGILNSRYLATRPIEHGALPEPDPQKRYVLYAHVPFCERLCTYCSFNRFLLKKDLARPYFKDLRLEMRRVAELGYDFHSFYIGGGTPTVLLDELVETLDLARGLFPSIAEVSSETNPNHLTSEMITALSGRVQRMSVGIQSFDDKLLKQMDRYEKYGSSDELFELVSTVAGAFPSFNVDMIFNFPSQTEESLANDVERVKATGANQTTFYPLMASPLRRQELAAEIGSIDFEREARYYQKICDGLSPEF
ncbi:MAG: radical SAM protein, partial [Coriobacteriia bacterium]|nr:radical SAM protein [Coriobacteriia bacterium]